MCFTLSASAQRGDRERERKKKKRSSQNPETTRCAARRSNEETTIERSNRVQRLRPSHYQENMRDERRAPTPPPQTKGARSRGERVRLRRSDDEARARCPETPHTVHTQPGTERDARSRMSLYCIKINFISIRCF